MNDEERERQRLQRLRDSQVRSRDPGPSKIRHYDWSNQRQRPRENPLHMIFGVIPTRVRGLAFGLLFGIVLALLIVVLAPSLEIIGVLLIPVAAVVGWIIGIAIQS